MSFRFFYTDRLGLILSFCLISCSRTSPDVSIRFIAEWEDQQELVIGFRTLEQDSMFDYVSLQMIRDLTPFIPVKVVIEDSSLLQDGMQLFFDQGIDTSNLDLLFESPTYYWLRDPAPIFLKNPDGKPAIADFRFSHYWNGFVDSLEASQIPLDSYDRSFAEKKGWPVVSSPLVMEGGGFEVNSSGTVILVESVVLNRNPGWTKGEIEKELKLKFGVKTIIWLPWGLAEDPYYMEHLYKDYYGFGTGGHSDEFVRFVNDSTVLLAWEFSETDTAYPLREMNKIRMQKNLDILEQARDDRNQAFKVVKMPIPEIFYKVVELDEGTFNYLMDKDSSLNIQVGQEIKIVACTSYLNYVISDGVVLLPSYWTPSVPQIQKEKDLEAKEIIQGFFPDRKILQINPLLLNFNGGGMHCTCFGVPEI